MPAGNWIKSYVKFIKYFFTFLVSLLDSAAINRFSPLKLPKRFSVGVESNLLASSLFSWKLDSTQKCSLLLTSLPGSLALPLLLFSELRLLENTKKRRMIEQHTENCLCRGPEHVPWKKIARFFSFLRWGSHLGSLSYKRRQGAVIKHFKSQWIGIWYFPTNSRNLDTISVHQIQGTIV